MQLFVQSQDIHTLDVSEETLVSEIKETVSDLEDIPAGELVAYYGGLPLDDDSFVCEAVPESGTVNVSMRLLGGRLLTLYNAHQAESTPILGKVHGSLARAGKVRGQTPKVCCGVHTFYSFRVQL